MDNAKESLSNALMGTDVQRKDEVKTILLMFKPGEKPDVQFTGYWDGKFLRAALNSISKAYRLRRNKSTGPAVQEQQEPAPKETGKKEEGDVGKVG